MRIKDVSALEVTVPLRNPARFATRTVRGRDFTITKVLTDDGIEGTGVVYMHVGTFVQRLLRPLILGEELLCVERTWSKMYRELYRDRKGAAIRAISSVDIALWDAIGKTFRKPVYKLLGGYRTEVPCYASGGYYREGKTLAVLVEEFAGYVKKGFKAVKMKIGGASLREDVERVRTVREVIGPDVDLMVDANNAYDVGTAIRAGRAFEKLDVFWFEEPVWPDNLHGSAQVANALDVPVASGELEYTKFGFRELIAYGAVDIIQPDVAVVGGVTEWMKVAKMAEAWSIPVAPHWAQEVHSHLVTAIPNGITLEWFENANDIRKEDELYKTRLETKDGMITVPDKPGFGIDLDETAVASYALAKL